MIIESVSPHRGATTLPLMDWPNDNRNVESDPPGNVLTVSFRQALYSGAITRKTIWRTYMRPRFGVVIIPVIIRWVVFGMLAILQAFFETRTCHIGEISSLRFV